MADEILYASVGGESNKRKYEDSPSPAARRSTGFSSPPDSGAPPSSYNSVPPAVNEIELAKQKAQEIAARLLNTSDPLKRARVENGGGGGGGFEPTNYGKGLWVNLYSYVYYVIRHSLLSLYVLGIIYVICDYYCCIYYQK